MLLQREAILAEGPAAEELLSSAPHRPAPGPAGDAATPGQNRFRAWAQGDSGVRLEEALELLGEEAHPGLPQLTMVLPGARGGTAMHLAAAAGHQEALEWIAANSTLSAELFAAGCLTGLDDDGYTPLHRAAEARATPTPTPTPTSTPALTLTLLEAEAEGEEDALASPPEAEPPNQDGDAARGSEEVPPESLRM